MTKQVVIIIVEGDSEQELLNDYLEKYFSNQKILFSVKNGDIFYSFDDRPPIKALIGEIIETEIRTNKYKRKDILAILHIADTDGCFIDKKNIIINPYQKEKTFYCLENIKVNSLDQKKRIAQRNEQKSFNSSFAEEIWL